MKCYSAAYIRSDRRVLSPTPTLPVHTGIIIFSHCYKAKGRETSILPLWRWPSLPRLAYLTYLTLMTVDYFFFCFSTDVVVVVFLTPPHRHCERTMWTVEWHSFLSFTQSQSVDQVFVRSTDWLSLHPLLFHLWGEVVNKVLFVVVVVCPSAVALRSLQHTICPSGLLLQSYMNRRRRRYTSFVESSTQAPTQNECCIDIRCRWRRGGGGGAGGMNVGQRTKTGWMGEW